MPHRKSNYGLPGQAYVQCVVCFQKNVTFLELAATIRIRQTHECDQTEAASMYFPIPTASENCQLFKICHHPSGMLACAPHAIMSVAALCVHDGEVIIMMVIISRTRRSRERKSRERVEKE